MPVEAGIHLKLGQKCQVFKFSEPFLDNIKLSLVALYMLLVALEKYDCFSMICILVLHHISKVSLTLAENNNLGEIFRFCDTT